MNAVEIEEAVTQLIEESAYDPAEFPYQFLEAFGNKATTIKKLQKEGRGSTNKTDLIGEDGVLTAVLQRTNIHLATCAPGSVEQVVRLLEASPATAKQKCKYVMATDGEDLRAIAVGSGEPMSCAYAELPDHFAFFLELAGISTVREIKENAFDIRATARLNKHYVELLKTNSDWDGEDRRQQLNHFFARLIFCFFAEDTNIFVNDCFTDTVQRISAPDASNVHEVLTECFRAMDTPREDREAAGIRPFAKRFPYVNGGLFGGAEGSEVPRFSKVARSYLLHIGNLDWKRINPDIFGSMIQAVADEDERAHLGMHYTSVPNILKVLNPLFLNSLRQTLEDCGNGSDVGSKRKLLNLRRRLTRIRVFDPACGSGNFLVIAYKELRKIEAEINRRRGEHDRDTDLPLTNFRGIEIRHFATEIARLALVIAEYQCNVLYQGETLAVKALLPLTVENWITHGNALRLDWEVVCPPLGKTGSRAGSDLFAGDEETEVGFENEGGEVYVCGNPPYVGSQTQSREQKADMRHVFEGRTKQWKSIDYIAAWLMKSVEYQPDAITLVSTNSICQGRQVSTLWPLLFDSGHAIHFAYTSFSWANLASHNAGVTVIIVGLTARPVNLAQIHSIDDSGETVSQEVSSINGYLVPGRRVEVEKLSRPLDSRSEMSFGNMPRDGGHLLLSRAEKEALGLTSAQERRFIRRIYGSKEFIRGEVRYCLWIEEEHVAEALTVPAIAKRIEGVRAMRLGSRDKGANAMAATPHGSVS